MKKKLLSLFKLGWGLQLMMLMSGMCFSSFEYKNIAYICYMLFVTMLAFTIILYILYIKEYHIDKKNTKTTNENSIQIKIPFNKITNTYIIEFPFCIVVYDEKEKIYKGTDVSNYTNNNELEDIQVSWENNKILNFIDDDNIKSKVNAMNLVINSKGTCRIFISTYQVLNSKEKEYIINFIRNQILDGWGKKNFKYTNGNTTYSFKFFEEDNDWYIKYIENDLLNMFIGEYKKITKKDCYQIDLLDEEPNIKDNKIGGMPYLPIGETYPVDKNGNPMLLMLQINLKDVQIEGYPDEGILELFTTKYPYENDFDYCVRYYDDNLDYQTVFDKNIDFKNENNSNAFIDESYKIELKKTYDFMPIADFRYDDIFKQILKDIYGIDLDFWETNFSFSSNELEEQLEKEIKSITPNISFGGYANFTQFDPRQYSELSNKTECLFKIDSEYDLDKICIGDSGILFALISKEDLKKKSFDSVHINWDCF